MRGCLSAVVVAVVAFAGAVSRADGQTLGSFSWQLAPYCNVITVTVTQNGSNYTLDGYDNQCGGSTRAAVVGMAVPNPAGTVTLGFTIVTPPTGTPVHVTTAIDLGSLGGSWSDDQGNTGTFVFTPAGVGTGSPRPAAINGLADNTVTSSKLVDGAVGAADINVAEVQRRVSSACPANQLMTAVNQDGTVVCQAVTSASGGDITAVTPGSGLTGGGAQGDVTLGIAPGGITTSHLAPNAVDASKVLDGAIGAADINQAQVQARVTGTCPAGQAMRTIAQAGTVTCEPIAGGAVGDITSVNPGIGLTGGGGSGDVTLNVAFAGSGSVGTVARSDHTHTTGLNTVVGLSARPAATGEENTAVGTRALFANTGGGSNTAVGHDALAGNTGSGNTAVGRSALEESLGFNNTAVGASALRASTGLGLNNTAIGESALLGLTTGDNNVALGTGAGGTLITGGSNVYVASTGAATESGRIRLGTLGTHTAFFAQGIQGVTTGRNNAQAVVVDGAGQLGTISSSRKTKFDIADLPSSVGAALQRLRPVQFRYTQLFSDGSSPIQYGLIAEEVEQVLPELVAYDEHDQPMTVKYHVLPGLLLAEVQRLEREREAQHHAIAALKAELAAIRTLLAQVAAAPR